MTVTCHPGSWQLVPGRKRVDDNFVWCMLSVGCSGWGVCEGVPSLGSVVVKYCDFFILFWGILVLLVLLVIFRWLRCLTWQSVLPRKLPIVYGHTVDTLPDCDHCCYYYFSYFNDCCCCHCRSRCSCCIQVAQSPVPQELRPLRALHGKLGCEEALGQLVLLTLGYVGI